MGVNCWLYDISNTFEKHSVRMRLLTEKFPKLQKKKKKKKNPQESLRKTCNIHDFQDLLDY